VSMFTREPGMPSSGCSGSTATEGIRTFIDELHGHPDVAIVRNLNGQAVAVRRAATTPAPGAT
jgi:hypothetical protein